MLNCGACGKFLSPVGAASCSVCPSKFHRACLALAEKTSISKDWLCPNCKRSARRGDNSQTPVKGVGEASESEPLPAQPDAGAAAGRTTVAGLDDFRREFAECMAEMREFRREMAQLRHSFTAITTRLDGVEQRLEALEQRQSGEGLGKVMELERTISELKLELDDRDQEALLADLEIGHLPEEKGVSVFHAVAVLAGQMGVKLEERDVVFAERVGAPPAEAGGRARRVVVRLARRQLRDELLQAARVRRAGERAAAGPRVFINERLTRAHRQLFHRVREECRRLGWRYTWTKRGRIFARQAEGKPAYQFRSEEDFIKTFGPPEVASE